MKKKYIRFFISDETKLFVKTRMPTSLQHLPYSHQYNCGCLVKVKLAQQNLDRESPAIQQQTHSNYIYILNSFKI